MNVYNSVDFVYNVPYVFSDRLAGQKDFFSSDMKPGEQEDRVVNVIPDLSAVTLDPHPERGEAELGVAHEREQISEVGQAISRQRRDLRSGPCVIARGDERRPVPAFCRGHRGRL